MSRLFRLGAVCGIVLALILLGSAGIAEAHSGAPLKTILLRVGPYPVMVHYYSEARGGQALAFSIEPQTGQLAPTSYKVTAIPGATTNATAVGAALSQASDHPNGIDGKVNLPVSGQWLLEIQVDGPLGANVGNAPVVAGAPPAIPEWVGWAIGLIPVGALGWFVTAQARQPRPKAA